MSRLTLGVIAVTAVIALACGDETPAGVSVPPLPGSPTVVDVGSPPPLEPDRVERGAALYGTHCAECHGGDLRGEADWQMPNADGTFRAPPHDGSGHTWHHSDSVLVGVIRDGSLIEISNMEGFGEVLSEDEILTILDFIKSFWTPDQREYQWLQTMRVDG